MSWHNYFAAWLNPPRNVSLRRRANGRIDAAFVETVLIKWKRFKRCTRNNPSSSCFSATYGREQAARVATQRNPAHRHALGADPVSPATSRIRAEAYTLHAALILCGLSSTPHESPMTLSICLLNNTCLVILTRVQKPVTAHRWPKLHCIRYLCSDS